MKTVKYYIKEGIYIVALSMLLVTSSKAQNIIINEVNQDGQWIELHNASATTMTDVTDWFLCNFPNYNRISSAAVTVISGSTNMPPKSFLVLGWSQINSSDGEVALYHNTTSSFGDATKIRDYMQYGSGNHTRAALASGQGFWDNAASFVPNATTSGNSLIMNDQSATGPTDTDSDDWIEGASSQGVSNFPDPCPPLLTLNDNPIDPDTYTAMRIESAGRVANNGILEVLLHAEQDVTLNMNFQVDTGGKFIAAIENCPE